MSNVIVESEDQRSKELTTRLSAAFDGIESLDASLAIAIAAVVEGLQLTRAIVFVDDAGWRIAAAAGALDDALALLGELDLAAVIERGHAVATSEGRSRWLAPLIAHGEAFGVLCLDADAHMEGDLEAIREPSSPGSTRGRAPAAAGGRPRRDIASTDRQS